jgi:hypothetical protein
MSEVMAKLSEPKDCIIAPDIAEATSSLQATKFSRELRFYMVVLKCEALQVV